jgi:pimeloyl-ACP methyl ester carboxylesterase
VLTLQRRGEAVSGGFEAPGGSIQRGRAALRPLRRRQIRRDFRKYAGDTRRGRRDLSAATEALPSFERPVLIVWAAEDRIMPPAHGGRLAELLPDSRPIGAKG